MKNIFSIIMLIGLFVTTVAFADGKCGDGGSNRIFSFGKDDYAVTWAIPIPKNAKVKFVSTTVFDSVSNQIGSHIPVDYSDKYTKNLKEVNIFNASIAWSVNQALDVEKRFGVEMSNDAKKVFEKYAHTGHDFIISLVEHPSVSSSANLNAHCSIVLQRGIITYENGKETLSFLSYFHTLDEAGNTANFVPQAGVEITFETNEIWFPLSFTKSLSVNNVSLILSFDFT